MFSQKAGVAQWEHAGLATQRKAVQVELGAKFVCWWRCEIGCERLGRCSINFFKQKKRNEKKKIMVYDHDF